MLYIFVEVLDANVHVQSWILVCARSCMVFVEPEASTLKSLIMTYGSCLFRIWFIVFICWSRVCLVHELCLYRTTICNGKRVGDWAEGPLLVLLYNPMPLYK